MAARNPKGERIMVRLSGSMSERLERLADQLGQNKSAMAGVCLSIGMNMMETMVFASEKMDIAEAMRAAQHKAEQQFDRDLQETGVKLEPQKSPRVGFQPKGELEEDAWVPSRGYMSGL